MAANLAHVDPDDGIIASRDVFCLQTVKEFAVCLVDVVDTPHG